MSLYQYYRTNRGRPINKWAHYLPIYERYFAAFRDRRVLFLEIGTGQGGSSQMWKDYLGPTAQVVTVDVRPECKAFEDEQVAVRIGDQSDTRFLQALLNEFGPPDIVLDDGSHQMAHVNASFRYLYPRMARDAVYMIEDTHTAYWPAWGGGLRKPGTIIEEMKGLIDELHAGNPHHDAQSREKMPISDISRMTRGVHVYPSIVVVEKGAFVNKAEHSIPLVEGQTVW